MVVWRGLVKRGDAVFSVELVVLFLDKARVKLVQRGLMKHVVLARSLLKAFNSKAKTPEKSAVSKCLYVFVCVFFSFLMWVAAVK